MIHPFICWYWGLKTFTNGLQGQSLHPEEKKKQNHKEESQDTAAKAGNDGILISASLQAKHAALGPQTIPCVKQTCQISSTTDVPVIAGAAIASRPGVSSTEQGG